MLQLPYLIRYISRISVVFLCVQSLEKAQQRSQLELLIATKDPTVQIVKQDKQTKSDVWSNDQYRMIYKDGVRQNFALCTECHALITHKSCYGTGGLLRHRCFRKRNGLMQTHGRGRRTRKNGGGGSGGSGCGGIVGAGISGGGGSVPRRRRRSSRQRLATRQSAKQSSATMTMMMRMASGTGSTASSCSSPPLQQQAIQPPTTTIPNNNSIIPTMATADGAEDTLTQIRHELETLIQHADPSVELLKPPAGSRSLVWTYQMLQMVYRDGERQDFVFCVECRQLLVHRVQAGTNRLLRHACIQAAIERNERAEQMQQHQQHVNRRPTADVANNHNDDANEENAHERQTAEQLTQQSKLVGNPQPMEYPDDSTPNTYVSPFMKLAEDAAIDANETATGIDADKKRIAKQQLYLMCREFMPVSLLDATGFQGPNSTGICTNSYQRLLQCLLSSAVDFGRFNAAQCFLDGPEVQRRIGQRRDRMHESLRSIVATEKLSFSCDVWPHRSGQLCCTLHGHYVDDSFSLRNVVLGTRVHREEAGDLFELCVQMLRVYVPGESRRIALRKLSNTTIVIDGDRNRNGMQRMINCVASGLNRIASELVVDSQVVQQICATVIVKLAEHATPEIRAMLLRFDGTRWETIWNLLTVYREIVGTVECPHEIDDILAMLDPLHEVAVCLGRFASQTPTINLVYPFRQKLLDVFASALDATTLAIKQKFLASINSNFVLTDLHRIAVFLDPRFKSLRFFSADERMRIIDMTKVLINDGTDDGSGAAAAVDRLSAAEHQTGRQPIHAHLADYMDDGIAEAPSVNEVDTYVRMQLHGSLRIADDSQVLAFWQQRDELPRLQNLVLQILCIPASCRADGCHFSAEAKRVLEMRTRIDGLDELDTALMVVCNAEI